MVNSPSPLFPLLSPFLFSSASPLPRISLSSTFSFFPILLSSIIVTFISGLSSPFSNVLPPYPFSSVSPLPLVSPSFIVTFLSPRFRAVKPLFLPSFHLSLPHFLSLLYMCFPFLSCLLPPPPLCCFMTPLIRLYPFTLLNPLSIRDINVPLTGRWGERANERKIIGPSEYDIS